MLSNDVYKDTVNFSSIFTLINPVSLPSSIFSQTHCFQLLPNMPWGPLSPALPLAPFAPNVPGGPLGPGGPSLPSFPMSPLSPRGPVPILENRESPQCLLAPRVQGFPAYLESLARKSRHHNHKVRMLETLVCPTVEQFLPCYCYRDRIKENDASAIYQKFYRFRVSECHVKTSLIRGLL